jgi:hypothetical protein
VRTFRTLGARVLAVALAFSFVPAAVPSGTPIVGISKAEAQFRYYGHGGDGYYGHRRLYRPGRYYGGSDRYYGRPGFYGRRGHYDRGYYGGRRYYRRHNDGAAIAAGIIGLGIGAAIANSARPRYYDYGSGYQGGSSHARYCAARYRSYDPYTNTFQPYYGPRRICR